MRRLLVAVAAVGLLAAGCVGEQDGPTSSQPSAPRAAVSQPSAPRANAPGSTSSGSAAATPSPPTAPDYGAMMELEWKPWHDVRLPYSDRYGPRQSDDQVATGFSHDPNGALIAMLHDQARIAVASDDSWATVARAEAVVAPTDTPPTKRLHTALTGMTTLPYYTAFRWRSYTPTRAEADIALQDVGGALSTFHVVEVWTGDDWRTEIPAAGAPPPTPIHSLDGYEPWPGVPR